MWSHSEEEGPQCGAGATVRRRGLSVEEEPQLGGATVSRFANEEPQ